MSDDGYYDGTPGAKTETPKERYTNVVQQFTEREGEILSMLPSNVSQTKFKNAALAAIKRDPMILNASPRSLMVAFTQAAQDGLLPDGKEGVINVYKGEAKWNPMIAGIRRRARELDNLLIDAQVVYKADKFVCRQGDDPAILHEPAQLGTPRGEMIGAYAIFKREDGDILHREVMDKQQVMDVKSQSKQQDGLLWGKFETEAWRKTVARRGIKTVPTSEGLMQIVTRDDDNFAFDVPEPRAKLSPPPAPTPKLEDKPGQVLDASVKKEVAPVVSPRSVADIMQGQADYAAELSDAAYAGILQDAMDEVNGCESEEAVLAVREKWIDDLKIGDRANFTGRCAERSAEIFGGG